MAGRQQTAPPQQHRSKDATAHPHQPGAHPDPSHPNRAHSRHHHPAKAKVKFPLRNRILMEILCEDKPAFWHAVVHLQHPTDTPLVSPTCDREAARSILHKSVSAVRDPRPPAAFTTSRCPSCGLIKSQLTPSSAVNITSSRPPTSSSAFTTSRYPTGT
jgi:hypothetical protein